MTNAFFLAIQAKKSPTKGMENTIKNNQGHRGFRAFRVFRGSRFLLEFIRALCRQKKSKLQTESWENTESQAQSFLAFRVFRGSRFLLEFSRACLYFPVFFFDFYLFIFSITSPIRSVPAKPIRKEGIFGGFFMTSTSAFP